MECRHLIRETFDDDDYAKDTTWTAPDAASTDQAYTLSLTVEDTGGLQVGDAITVIVRANQHRPSRLAPLRQTVDGGTTVNLAATASDPDDEADDAEVSVDC